MAFVPRLVGKWKHAIKMHRQQSNVWGENTKQETKNKKEFSNMFGNELEVDDPVCADYTIWVYYLHTVLLKYLEHLVL